MSASTWTNGLDPQRLAAVEARNRTMVYTPPPAAAISDNAARAVVAAAWARAQNAVGAEHARTLAPFGLEMQKRNAAEAKARAAEAKAKARAKQKADDQNEDRRAMEQAAILATSADTGAAVAVIRAEVASILEARP